MGMYTEVFFRAELKKDTPTEVLALLGAWVEGRADDMDLPVHPFFECLRWDTLPGSSSAYFPTGEPSLTRSAWCDQWVLKFHSSLKDYSNEAAKFFDWISPYTEGYGGEFLGYTLYEESETPTLYHRMAT